MANEKKSMFPGSLEKGASIPSLTRVENGASIPRMQIANVERGTTIPTTQKVQGSSASNSGNEKK